jgi:hypothetical protein
MNPRLGHEGIASPRASTPTISSYNDKRRGFNPS